MPTKKNIVIKRFLEFLKKNNALKKYKKNIIELSRFRCNNNWAICLSPFTVGGVKDAVGRGRYADLIMYSFCWQDTNEGHKYWDKLDRKWRKIIDEEIKK